MSTIAWQAYYFDSFENSLPPALTELIEAESLDDAAKIAKSHMGRCTRVDITSPVWEWPQSRVILASEGLPERPALH
jgi:hypothetical protein